mgnify:CR=1 FL=1
MSDIISVNDEVSLRIDSVGNAKAKEIIIEDKYDHIFISIDDWQAFKDAGDKLIADSKDG